MDLSFLDKEEEFAGELSPKHKEVVAPVVEPEPPPAKDIIVSEPTLAEAMVMPSKATSSIVDPKEKVGGLNL